MPYKNKKPCRYPGCPKLTTSYYCDEHKVLMDKEYDKCKRPYEHRERYGTQWDKLRNIYIKAHPLCEECLKQNISTPATLVHHIKPISDGGEILDKDNLESLCSKCHTKIHRILERNKVY